MPRDNPHEAATALVERAQNGDRAAFDELVRRYRSRVLALTLHLTGCESEAEDVTQEVFVKAFGALAQFEGRSHFFTWLYRMAVNRSLNARRAVARRREEWLEDPRVGRAVAIDAAGDPRKAALLRETYSRLVVELDRLPEEMRTSVVLVTLQGLSQGEAAVVQGCAAGTVAWRIHEARRRLHDALNEPKPVMKRREKRDVGELSALLREWALASPAST